MIKTYFFVSRVVMLCTLSFLVGLMFRISKTNPYYFVRRSCTYIRGRRIFFGIFRYFLVLRDVRIPLDCLLLLEMCKEKIPESAKSKRSENMASFSKTSHYNKKHVFMEEINDFLFPKLFGVASMSQIFV